MNSAVSSYLSVCPGLMLGDTVSAGETVMCVRLTPGVKVKCDRVSHRVIYKGLKV